MVLVRDGPVVGDSVDGDGFGVSGAGVVVVLCEPGDARNVVFLAGAVVRSESGWEASEGGVRAGQDIEFCDGSTLPDVFFHGVSDGVNEFSNVDADGVHGDMVSTLRGAVKVGCCDVCAMAVA